MELEINGLKLKVYESGEIYRLNKKGWILHKSKVNCKGYSPIKLNNKSFLKHRVIYKAFNPDWDITDSSLDNQIDHINRVRDDNRIINLRVVTNQQNQQNNNCKGYYWHNTKKRWISKVWLGKKTYSKYCKTEEEAIQAVHELRTKYYEFYERTLIPEGE